MSDYILTPGDCITITSSAGIVTHLKKSTILESTILANRILRDVGAFEIDIYALLGMRNLSSFVGEVFAHSLLKNTSPLFIKNPHQDGYPDMLLLDDAGKKMHDALSKRLHEKGPFSPFPNGGIEVKATCGAINPGTYFTSKSIPKPDIGATRVKYLKSYDWKAHHRDTNNLMGIFWDFVDSKPTIVALFYSGSLTVEDWGVIVKPKVGGGKTTSVSIMTRKGVKKMYDGTILHLKNKDYTSFFNSFNQENRL